MAKKAGSSADDLVKDALLKVATSETPLRLTGKGDHPALFTKANPATARLLDETEPLLAVVGTGKTTHVRLTAAGFRYVLPHLPEEKIGGAAKQLAAGLPPVARAEFLNEIVSRTPTAAAELLPAYEEAVAAEKAELEARAAESARRRAAEEASREAIRRWLELADVRKQQRIEAIRKELEAEGGKVPVLPPPSPPPPATPERTAPLTPETAEDRDFRRQVARRLVSAWLETWDLDRPDARQFLETAIWNLSGFRQVGEVGQRLAFDGALHEGPPGVFPGDPVRVVRPGWVLEEEDGREYRVLKALVSA